MERRILLSALGAAPRVNMTCDTYPREISEQRGSTRGWTFRGGRKVDPSLDAQGGWMRAVAIFDDALIAAEI